MKREGGRGGGVGLTRIIIFKEKIFHIVDNNGVAAAVFILNFIV